jgi:opacity protein-like surface antigen
MRARFVVFGTVAALAVCAGQVRAQQLPISIEAAAGAALPLGDLQDVEVGGASTGFGFRLGGAYRVTPQFAVYAGYSRYGFDVNDAEVAEFGFALNWTDSGFNAGARLTLPAAGAETAFTPWIEAGLASRSIELSRSFEGRLTEDSFARTLGFEAAGGLSIGIAQQLAVGPAIRYVRYRPDAFYSEAFEEELAIGVQYLGLEVRLSYRF